MIRIKDPKVSLKWYKEVLGFELINESPSEAAKFTNYFLTLLEPGETVEQAKANQMSRVGGIIELCWNWGTEKEDAEPFPPEEQKRFGHLAISVDDVQVACDRFEKMGVNFKKRPNEGRMKNIAFIRDPDKSASAFPTKSTADAGALATGSKSCPTRPAPSRAERQFSPRHSPGLDLYASKQQYEYQKACPRRRVDLRKGTFVHQRWVLVFWLCI